MQQLQYRDLILFSSSTKMLSYYSTGLKADQHLKKQQNFISHSLQIIHQ